MSIRSLFKYILVVMTLLIVSCDGTVGYNGVVQDKVSGDRLRGVKVIMDSYYKSIEVLTYSNGYFQTLYTYSGDFTNNPSFTISFQKEGYAPLVINEEFYSDPETEFINNDTKDTLIVKLTPVTK